MLSHQTCVILKHKLPRLQHDYGKHMYWICRQNHGIFTGNYLYSLLRALLSREAIVCPTVTIELGQYFARENANSTKGS